MLQQDPLQTHLSSARMPAWQHAPNMVADDSPTFVKPAYEGSPQSFLPYTFAPESATRSPETAVMRGMGGKADALTTESSM